MPPQTRPPAVQRHMRGQVRSTGEGRGSPKAKTKNKTELTGFFEKMTEIHVTIKKDAKK